MNYRNPPDLHLLHPDGLCRITPDAGHQRPGACTLASSVTSVFLAAMRIDFHLAVRICTVHYTVHNLAPLSKGNAAIMSILAKDKLLDMSIWTLHAFTIEQHLLFGIFDVFFSRDYRSLDQTWLSTNDNAIPVDRPTHYYSAATRTATLTTLCRQRNDNHEARQCLSLRQDHWIRSYGVRESSLFSAATVKKFWTREIIMNRGSDNGTGENHHSLSSGSMKISGGDDGKLLIEV